MADYSKKRKELEKIARDRGLKINEVRGYLLTEPGSAYRGIYCPDLDTVERRLNEIQRTNAGTGDDAVTIKTGGT